MSWKKTMADGLTVLRLLAALVLVVWGIFPGTRAMSGPGLLLIFAWTTDFLDGPLARSRGRAGQDWLGRSDLPVDMILATALLFFMARHGLVSPLLALAHVVLWAVILWRYGSLTKPVGAAFRGPIYLWFGVILLGRRLTVSRLMLLWVLGAVAATWKRLSRRDVPRFFQGIRALSQAVRNRSPEAESLDGEPD